MGEHPVEVGLLPGLVRGRCEAPRALRRLPDLVGQSDGVQLVDRREGDAELLPDHHGVECGSGRSSGYGLGDDDRVPVGRTVRQQSRRQGAERAEAAEYLALAVDRVVRPGEHPHHHALVTVGDQQGSCVLPAGERTVERQRASEQPGGTIHECG